MSQTGTIQELLRASTSQIHFDDGTSTSASELANRGAKTAEKLASHLAPGDRLALWLDPGLAYLELLAAAAAGGFVAVNVNTRYSDAEVADLVKRSGAKILVTNFNFEPIPSCLMLNPSDLQNLPVAEHPHEASANSAFTVFTTSGTTSKPKMVLHNQGPIVRHSEEVASKFKLSPLTPVLVALPLCGVFGLNSLFGGIAADAPVWVSSRFQADTTAGLIEAQQIVAMNGSDDMFSRLLDTGHDISSLKIAGFGAFNTSLEDVAVWAEARGAKLSGLYGMSEVQALFAFTDQMLPLPARAGAGGLLTSPNAKVRVIDTESGVECEIGEVGEIQAKGPSLFVGYLSEGGNEVDISLTESSHTDGWFKTGDLGKINPDGSFTFIARMGDVLRLGGFLVAPVEIEEVILQLSEIEEAQVVSINTKDGTRPVAFVIEQAGLSAATQDQLEATVIEHCNNQLAKFKCPVRVISLDEFPATDGPNGVKIQRGKLREMAEASVTI